MSRTIAQEIAARIKADPVCAVTLACGYAVHYNGSRTLFPPARIVKERRNDSGRCTYLLARYSDDSELTFTWHPQHGARYRAIASKG